GRIFLRLEKGNKIRVTAGEIAEPHIDGLGNTYFKIYKEQPTKKPIFENEEECREFLDKICTEGFYSEYGKHEFIIHENQAIEKSKKLGYIQQSELEKARENWEKFMDSAYDKEYVLDSAYYDYITVLENELERLKNENK
ncbi:MAG: hypothetical protein ACFFG0_42375, partial [Candidatus Thorarchaeota archaeon]